MPKWMTPDKISMKNLRMRIKFVISEPRWTIIKIIGNETKGTNEIYDELEKWGFAIPRSTLYYHLSSLENEGIIEMAGYREEGGGAPEKLWKLKVKKICMDLISGEIVEE
jgi:DNA-binding transcriptional ArsR family regulator